jgi:hypothetical protein
MDGQLNGDAANASTIVANLSILIQRAMTSHEAHRTLPDGTDPDRTDDRIAFYRTRVDALRKVSPKVKALTEVRTYMIQHREQVLAGKTGVDRDIENERFERMLDSVEALFPPGHSFTIRRSQGAPAQANPAPLQAVQ